MGYISGSVGSSNYPQKYIAGLEAEMLLVGWVFVEEVVVGTYLHRVWKNPAALNRESKDFYVILRRLASPTGVATSVWICAGREYKTSATPANVTLRVGYGYGNATSLYLSENATGRDLKLQDLPYSNSPITSTSVWWATITKNYMATFTTENGEACYAGLYLVYDHYREQVQALALEDIFIPVCSVDLPDGYPVFNNLGSNRIMNPGAVPGFTGEYVEFTNTSYRFYAALLPSETQIINPSQPGALEELYPFSYWELHVGGQGPDSAHYLNNETPAIPIGRLEGVGSCYFPSAVVRGDTVHVEDPISNTTETYVVTQSLSSGTYACISTGTLLAV